MNQKVVIALVVAGFLLMLAPFIHYRWVVSHLASLEAQRLNVVVRDDLLFRYYVGSFGLGVALSLLAFALSAYFAWFGRHTQLD